MYRLIAANSIEQRVLRLQAHKLGVASAVVSRENASAFSNGTGGILGMLGEAMGAGTAAAKAAGEASGTTTITAGGSRQAGLDAAGGVSGVGQGGGGELWSADEDYAYLAAERLADSVARE